MHNEGEEQLTRISSQLKSICWNEQVQIVVCIVRPLPKRDCMSDLASLKPPDPSEPCDIGSEIPGLTFDRMVQSFRKPSNPAHLRLRSVCFSATAPLPIQAELPTVFLLRLRS